jgi:hypothetical protein
MSLILTGRVSFRSSVKRRGPPGEREIIKLNPHRRDNILRIAKWSHLEPGTLNVDVDDVLFDKLTPEAAAWIEDGASVIYPPGFEHIPKKRGAYFYYLGTLHAHNETHPIVVRRAKVPGPIRIEVYAPENLTKSLRLVNGGTVELRIA